MNNLFSRSTFALVNLAALAVCCTTLSVKAETGNLPDTATSASLPSQNIPELSESVATAAAKTDAVTTASNKQIDSISSLQLDGGVKSELVPETATSESPTNVEASAMAPATSDVANSEIPATENLENTSMAAETKDSEPAATIADNSIKVCRKPHQGRSRLKTRNPQLPSPIIALKSSLLPKTPPRAIELRN
ncbi:MAG: hypothetical protein P7H58_05665 [Microcoleus anatoxicus]